MGVSFETLRVQFSKHDLLYLSRAMFSKMIRLEYSRIVLWLTVL